MRAEYKLIDLEARSRRQNLIFMNIDEQWGERDIDCEYKLRQFISYNMCIGDYSQHIVFQRVHRLGKLKSDKIRPIIAAFRDDQIKTEVLKHARNLKGSRFAVNQDWPSEIRTARGRLWPAFTRARADNKRAHIAYPAALVVEGRIEQNEFPEWTRVLYGQNNGIRQQSNGNIAAVASQGRNATSEMETDANPGIIDEIIVQQTSYVQQASPCLFVL